MVAANDPALERGGFGTIQRSATSANGTPNHAIAPGPDILPRTGPSSVDRSSTTFVTESSSWAHPPIPINKRTTIKYTGATALRLGRLPTGYASERSVTMMKSMTRPRFSTLSPESHAIATAQALIDAFNSQDHERLAGTLNYPHTRLALGRFRSIYNAQESVAASAAAEPRLADEGWHHSVIAKIDPVHVSVDKVHLAMTVERCHKNRLVYSTFDTLWIATLDENHWGIKFRSSFLR